MNRARDQLLAGAALAAQQNGGVVGDDAPDQLVDFLHRGAAADYLAADELAIDFVLEAVEIGGLRADFDRALDRGGDQVEIGERLGQVVVRAALHRLDRVVHRARGGDHDDERADAFAVRGGQHVETAVARHDDVEQGDVEAIAAQGGERRGAVDCLFDAMAVGFEPMPQDEADGGIVVGDQDRSAGAGILHAFSEVLVRCGCAHAWLCSRGTIVTVSSILSPTLAMANFRAGFVGGRDAISTGRSGVKKTNIHSLVVSGRPHHQG